MIQSRSFALVLHSAAFDRVHYALAIATAAAATGRETTVLFAGRSVYALLAQDEQGAPGWHRLDAADDGTSPALRDRVLTSLGVVGLEELLTSCDPLEINVIACEMALRTHSIPKRLLFRQDVPVKVAGIVTFLAKADNAAVLFI